ncbi:MAG: AAA family ATPase [Kiritimatiellae bacterium]|nr:AAA family ATPase [Kiritimatiellia bacterium]
MFYGREDILEDMMSLWGKRVSSLVTCRGRRRIGKSTLVAEFARKSSARFIRIEGIKPKREFTKADELQNFAMFLSLQSNATAESYDNWARAFEALAGQIDDDGRIVILLDEISWMAHGDPHFPDILKIAWDTMFKKHDRLILVLCGSVSSWIKDNIIDNSAYLGRRSGDFVVGELPLRDCVKFWGATARNLASRDILDVLSVTGGVPRYLEEINPALSANENIRRMCFARKSPLREDFDDMFFDVITEQQTFTGQVLRCLADGPRTPAEVASKLGLPKGGNTSAALDRLVEAGLVARDHGRNPETGRPVRERRYRLMDNYTKFYLKFIEPVKDIIDDGSYAFTSLDQLKGIDVVLGLAFENLVVNHYREILPRLGLSRALIESAAPFAKRGNAKKNRGGCQVDLLIQTAQSCCLVEVKRRKEIGDEVLDEVKEKLEALSLPKDTSVRTALVYDGRLAATVEASGYFNSLVDVHELLF